MSAIKVRDVETLRFTLDSAGVNRTLGWTEVDGAVVPFVAWRNGQWWGAVYIDATSDPTPSPRTVALGDLPFPVIINYVADDEHVPEVTG